MKHVAITLLVFLSCPEHGHTQSYRYMLNPKVITLDTLEKSSSKAFTSQNTHLPFFCRIEKIADTKSGIKLRVRLGDVHYVDQLEQKNTLSYSPK